MCTKFSSRTYVLKRPRTVYKYAPNGRSEYAPQYRSRISGFSDGAGVRLRYPVGKTVVSPSGPGIMAYPRLPRFHERGEWYELLIPKGATIRRGKLGRLKETVVAASKVKVVRAL